MSEKTVGCNPRAHQGHLCLLVSEGQLEKVKTLVTKPRHICFNCGRVADSDKNLCNPMPLLEDPSR